MFTRNVSFFAAFIFSFSASAAVKPNTIQDDMDVVARLVRAKASIELIDSATGFQSILQPDGSVKIAAWNFRNQNWRNTVRQWGNWNNWNNWGNSRYRR